MKNNPLDQFYTKKYIAKKLLDKTLKITQHIEHPSLYLDPSAGDGSFFLLFPENRIGLDLEPKHQDIIKQDFLKYIPDNIYYQKIWTIGNPPFGKNSSLAIKFFNHASKFSDVIAFILPRTFQKQSLQNKLNLNFKILYEEILDKNSFMCDGKDFDAPCIFQIWKFNIEKRVIFKKYINHIDFEFTTKLNGEFSFQRIGVNAGKVRKHFYDRSENSHYFIKDKSKDKNVYDILSKINWEEIKKQNAGNPSISKSELIQEYLSKS